MFGFGHCMSLKRKHCLENTSEKEEVKIPEKSQEKIDAVKAETKRTMEEIR